MAQHGIVRLGDWLVENKLISSAQLDSALKEQVLKNEKLGDTLINQGLVTEQQVCEAVAEILHIPFIDLKDYKVDSNIARKLPEAQARRFQAIILKASANSVLVGMADPMDMFAIEEIPRLLGSSIKIAIVAKTPLSDVIKRVYSHAKEISELAKTVSEGQDEYYVNFETLGASLDSEETPVVRLLRGLFEDATHMRASDIHIEPQEADLQIRFRVDGRLQLQNRMGIHVAPALALRLKVCAGLNISEKRLPQDGRFNVQVGTEVIDVRLSIAPTQFGESVVMRLLNHSMRFLQLDHLGLPEEVYQRFQQLLKRTHGMILVTGPTGSGKTTTLYAALAEVNSMDRNIITVEDPVEYRLPGTNQIQVNEKIGLSFTSVLRSALRQDPDMILVGEIRDVETAHIALRAAMTGHLVFSTLHTNDASGTLFRLIDMGVAPFMVASSVHAVIAQRLVRRICENCSEQYIPTGQETEWLDSMGVAHDDWAGLRIGKGCSHCSDTGCYGRTGIYEMLVMDNELAEAAVEADSAIFMKLAQLRLKGVRLQDAALQKMKEGTISLQEAMQVCIQSER